MFILWFRIPKIIIRVYIIIVYVVIVYVVLRLGTQTKIPLYDRYGSE
jgi:hypothetical protein